MTDNESGIERYRARVATWMAARRDAKGELGDELEQHHMGECHGIWVTLTPVEQEELDHFPRGATVLHYSEQLQVLEAKVGELRERAMFLQGELDEARWKADFRRQTLKTFLVYLFIYEMPLDRLRLFLERVEDVSMNDFASSSLLGTRSSLGSELLERLERIEVGRLRRRREEKS